MNLRKKENQNNRKTNTYSKRSLVKNISCFGNRTRDIILRLFSSLHVTYNIRLKCKTQPFLFALTELSSQGLLFSRSRRTKLPDSLKQPLKRDYFKFPEDCILTYIVHNVVTKGYVKNIETVYERVPRNRKYEVEVNHLGDIFGFIDSDGLHRLLLNGKIATINMYSPEEPRELTPEEVKFILGNKYPGQKIY